MGPRSGAGLGLRAKKGEDAHVGQGRHSRRYRTE